MVLLPYYFSIPYQADLLPYEFDYDEYKVKVYPPKQGNTDYSALDVHSQEPMFSIVNNLKENLIVRANDAIKIFEQETINANLFQMDVWAKRDFNRDKDNKTSDPPIETLFGLVDIHLGKLRTIGRLPHVRYLNNREDIVWKVEYLNDDETVFKKDETKKRKDFQSLIPLKLSPISKTAWEKACSLPNEYKPPLWDSLLLDALDLFPEVNASIVLVNAALESCINFSLDILAKNSSLSDELWNWIKRDNNFVKQPSIKEKFDQMLLLVCGRSMRLEEADLWNAFIDLRDARNSMVHRGKACIKRGTKKKMKEIEITPNIAFELISNASQIIEWIESLLPSEFKKPSPVITEITVSKNVVSNKEDDELYLQGFKGSIKNLEILNSKNSLENE